MFNLDLEKAEEPEIKLPTSVGSLKKLEFQKKTSTSALLMMPKPLCGSQQIVENSEKDGNTRPTDLPPKESVCRSRSNTDMEPDMEQQAGSKLGKEYIKAIYCHPAYLTYSRVQYIM